MVATMRDRMRHVLNPLHVYCTLAHILKRRGAMWTARAYERLYNNVL